MQTLNIMITINFRESIKQIYLLHIDFLSPIYSYYSSSFLHTYTKSTESKQTYCFRGRFNKIKCKIVLSRLYFL
jgi:hypothetical protein